MNVFVYRWICPITSVGGSGGGEGVGSNTPKTSDGRKYVYVHRLQIKWLHSQA